MKKYVVSRTTKSGGQAYLVRRPRTNVATPAYRWAKRSVTEAAKLSYDAARSAARRYKGGYDAV